MSEKTSQEYWIKKANADRDLPMGIRQQAGYFDWILYEGCADETRPISTLIKKAIKEAVKK